MKQRSKPRLALVEVVGEVAGEVGAVAVGPDDHPVLVVAVLLGAQPERTVLLVGVPELGQPVDGLLHRAAGVQVVLVEVDVEVDAELVEALLDLREHHRDALGAEDLLRLVVGKVQDAGVLGQHRLRDVVDVGAAVAVLGHRPAVRAGQQRPAEPVDLAAVVVEVVLPGDLGAGLGEDAPERVTDGGPPHATDVQRAGRVGGDELEVDLLARERVRGPVRRTGGHHVRGDLALRAGGDRDVEEPGTRDVHRGDAVGRPQLLGEQLAQRPRVGARPSHRLGQLERHVGGVVAVTLLPRTLHRHLAGTPSGRVSRPSSTSAVSASTMVVERSAGFTAPAYRRPSVSFAGISPGSLRGAPTGLRSSGDRALVSGTRCRRFESCRRRPPTEWRYRRVAPFLFTAVNALFFAVEESAQFAWLCRLVLK